MDTLNTQAQGSNDTLNTQTYTGTQRRTQAYTGTYRHIQAHTGTHRHTQAHTGMSDCTGRCPTCARRPSLLQAPTRAAAAPVPAAPAPVAPAI